MTIKPNDTFYYLIEIQVMRRFLIKKQVYLLKNIINAIFNEGIVLFKEKTEGSYDSIKNAKQTCYFTVSYCFF